MKGTFLFLGTGGSMGIPVVTCRCHVCLSTDPHNHRLRPSGLLRIGGRQILFDAGPDFRQQALTYGIDRLDGVVLTHMHYDHIAGLDDLRVFYFFKHQTLTCLLSEATYHELKKRNPYFFESSSDEIMGGSRFQFQVIKEKSCIIDFCNLQWQIVSYEQNQMQVTGYRIGRFAYVMDLKHYSWDVIESLKGVEVLVLSGLRHSPSHAHLSLEEALEFSRQVGARMTWFSHISHEMDHQRANQLLPPDAQLAYDGLEISTLC